MTEAADRERRRLLGEYKRRRRELPADLYAPWNRAEQFMRLGRRRLAASMLHAAGVFPDAASQCLEVGFGGGGWLTDLLEWGAAEPNLHGVEIDPFRMGTTHGRLPAAQLVLADAAELPYPDARFDLVVVSTVFTSILDDDVRHLVAQEIHRVLRPGGALLWYDFAIDNPRNRNVRGVPRSEVRSLFPDLQGMVRRVTLAAPLARRVAPRAWWLAELLETVPILRTHLVAVLVKRVP